MVEIEAVLPLVGILVTGGIVPVVVKKLDLGRAAKDRMAEKLEDIEKRLRQTEIDIVKLQRNNHQRLK